MSRNCSITHHFTAVRSGTGVSYHYIRCHTRSTNDGIDQVKGSGMRNADGLFNDGIDFNTCANNGQVRAFVNTLKAF